MGEVGTNSPDSPHVDLKMNGGINGNCEDDAEAMDIDAQDTSTESIAKNADNSDQPTSTNDSNNVVELDISGNSDGVELVTADSDKQPKNVKPKTISESETCENGSNDECDQKSTADEISTEKITADDDNDSVKLDEDRDASVKVSSDPLSADAEPIEDDKRTNQRRPQSTENGTSATTITSSNDNNGKFNKSQYIKLRQCKH